MKKKEFKSSSKRVLDLMINSIYTNKEIFLRELLSNASDAIDKLVFTSLTDSSVSVNRDDLKIVIERDKDARVLKISDNGIGMDEAELEHNLGTIAESGSLKFKEENKDQKDTSIIGQFGVGFYSAFMVAKKIEVISKKYNADKAYKWTSEGADGYTIQTCDKDETGTTIVLYLKDDTDDDNYSHVYKAIKSIINDGSWRKDEWVMKCQQQPSTENELHPYHTFSYNAELNVYVYCIIKPLCD